MMSPYPNQPHDNYSGWLNTVPPEGRQRIKAIMTQEESDIGHGRHKREPGRWWVRLAPSTGTPRDVTLLLRQDSGRTREWPIMRKGELVE